MILDLQAIKERQQQLKEKFKIVSKAINIIGCQTRVNELEDQMSEPSFWNDQNLSQTVNKELKLAKGKIDRHNRLEVRIEDVDVMIELAQEEDDAPLIDEVAEGLTELEEDVEQLRLETLLSGPYDANNAIIEIHPGAGGTESMDWAAMLLRMYTRWAEKRDFTVKTLDFLPGDVAGVKSVTLQISGENAYGYLKAEKGVHRLVRISPFDASGRRHTSFASLDVMPEMENDIGIDINQDDLKIDTYRSGGAGGQHVNKTDSAVRITHLPTNTVVQCQNERSQTQNKESAMKVLMARLLELKEREAQAVLDKVKGEQKSIEWGSQIRSYVLQPYNMVKDHRTNVEVGNINAVMDGEIDVFINTYLQQMT
jgi:peptide chain release factor 2